VLRPVFAPAFIPAADSGDTSIGGPKSCIKSNSADSKRKNEHKTRKIAGEYSGEAATDEEPVAAGNDSARLCQASQITHRPRKYNVQ
jgi:hypothetical protein